MKAKHLFFILLALCVVFFLTSCDGGGSSGGGDDRTGKTFIVTDISPNPGIVITRVPGKGIKFTQEGIDQEIHVILKFYDDKTFSSVQKFWMDGVEYMDSVFTGTWVQNDLTITASATKEKDNLGGTTETINPPDVVDFTLSADGNTLSQTEIDPGYQAKLIFTKQ